MRAFLLVTGVAFAAIVVAHVWRIAAEGPRLAHEPFFVGLTIAALALSVWAFALFRAVGKRRG